jgi:hypothetical protein
VSADPIGKSSNWLWWDTLTPSTNLVPTAAGSSLWLPGEPEYVRACAAAIAALRG